MQDSLDAFHDWYFDGLLIKGDQIEISVHLYGQNKRIRLNGVTRCLLNNFMIQNVIHDLRVISSEDDALFRENQLELDKHYPAPKTKAVQRILLITASVGVEGLIEFSSLDLLSAD